MKVEKWINSYDVKEDSECSIGGMGGFFQNGMRWVDYIECFSDKGKEYAEALRESIVETGLKCTGRDHQNSQNCTPVFDDGTHGGFSFRAWGDLMAAVWSEKENKDYCYMDFYY